MSTRGRAEDRHIPVLRDRILDLLAPALTEPGSVYVDATLGMGGHAEAMLERCPQARARRHRPRPGGAGAGGGAARAASPTASPSCTRSTTSSRPSLADLGIREVHAALFDLGVSSLQLDESDRGFAYSQDAPLDMRMDQSRGLTAADVLNTYEAADLERDPARVRRGALRAQDRRGDRQGARGGAVHHLRPAGGPAEEGRPRRLPEERRPPRQAHLPGAAHRGQRRAVGLGQPRCRPPSTRSPSAAASPS